MRAPEERQELLRHARQGNREALGTLLESFRPYIRVLVNARWSDRAPARIDRSDLIQDALVQALASFTEFRGTTVPELVTWLRIVVIRSVGGTARAQLDAEKRDPTREHRVEEVDGLAAGSSNSPVALAISHEEELRLAEALDQLPIASQQVLLARHRERLPYEQIARRLGKTSGAVRVLYSRALQGLRDLLAE